MSMSLLIAGLMTGIVLGVFGSGGSIVTTPALLYMLDVDPKSAIAMSLGIVGITATMTAIHQWRMGNVNLKVTAVFGLFGVIGTYAGARIGVFTPVVIQLGVFALVMYAAAWRMLKSKPAHKSLGSAAVECLDGNCDLQYMHIAFHGIAVGVLTGVVGVGGGFLIIPSLVLLSGLSMKHAIGTSLSIVAIKSFAGFAGYAGSVEIDFNLILSFSAIAIGASFVGSMVGQRLSGEKLKKGFGVFLVLVASYIIVKNVI